MHQCTSMYINGVFKMDVMETSKVLSDTFALKILSITQKRPCTVQFLSQELVFPLTGTYKKIKELEKEGFIEPVDRILTQNGKRVTRFKSKVKGFFVQFYNDELRITLEMDSENDCIKMVWNALEMS